MIRIIMRRLALALVICLALGAAGCGAGKNSAVTVSIPLDPQQTSITGLKAQVMVSGMSGSFVMNINTATSTASVTIDSVPSGSRTFTITFYIGTDVMSGIVVAEVSLTRNVSDVDLNITYTDTDISYDFDDDSDGFRNYDEIIAGTDPNNPSDYPYVTLNADAGADQTGSVGTDVTLDGSNSQVCAGTDCIFIIDYPYDPDVTITWTWSFTSKPTGSSAYLQNSTSYTTGFTPDVAGTYVINLTTQACIDVNCVSDSDTVNVTVGSSGGGPWTASNLGAGGYHTCAVTSAGGVKCWGCNDAGRLGNGSSTGPQTCNDGTNTLPCSETPVNVSSLSGISKVIGGGYHSCALNTTGGVKCWGSNVYGQLGNGSTTASSVPVDVTGLTSGVASVSAGLHHTCALMSAGGVKCWGENVYGKLGTGSADGPTTCNDGTNNVACSKTPVNVINLTGTVTAVSAGLDHTCVLMSTGTIRCWGRNTWGALGDGTQTDSTYPVAVSGVASGATAVSASPDGWFTCAVVSGAAKCWGSNDYGLLGVSNSSGPEWCNGGGDPCSTIPVNVAGLTTGVTGISTGAVHSCAILNTGGMRCWGYNVDGELGNNSTTDSYTPVTPVGLSSGVSQISVGYYFSCARTTSNLLKCWGNNYYGQVGDGTSGGEAQADSQKITPVNVDMTQ